MRANLESVYAALFALVCQMNAPQANGQPSLTPLKTSSRRWRPWASVGSDEMPAFFQMQPPSLVQPRQSNHFGLSKYDFKANLWFYFPVNVDDTSTPMSPILNAYYTALDALLQPTLQTAGGARQQLGVVGVENAWISTVVMDEGMVTPPAILMAEVTITTG